ncbi:MAG: hypothetical protein AVDCRST_MAG89-3085, partial [uncultured Gemmatimonadetes bacterium]
MYAQIDTSGVQVPPDLAEFCRPGTASLRATGAHPSGSGDSGEPLSATDLYREKNSRLDQPVRCVVRRAEEWAALWSAMTRQVSAASPPPPVDFERAMVLVAGMGIQPSTGYGIGVADVRRTANTIEATVLRYTPGLCTVGMAETEPVHAVSIPRENTPIQFI